MLEKKEENEQLLKDKEEYLRQDPQVFGHNTFQFLFSSWLAPLANLSHRLKLDKSLIPRLQQADKNKENFQEFNQIFQQQKDRGNHKGLSLLKTMVLFFKKEFIILIFEFIITVGLQTYIPIFNYQIINYLEGTQKNTKSSVQYFVIFVVLYLLKSITYIGFAYYNKIVGIFISNTLSLMIYNKVLRYPIISSKQFDSSEIINFTQVDCLQFEHSFSLIKETFSNLLQIIINCFLVFHYIGVSAFAGLVVLTIFFLIILLMLYFALIKAQKLSQANDSRIKIAEQIIEIIKFIKINCLEKYFLKKILASRQVELQIRSLISLFYNINMALPTICSPLMVISSIIATQWFGGELSTAKIFLLITVFSNIQLNLIILTQNSREIVHLWISIKRIQNFLLTEEINTQVVEYKQKGNSPFSIQIYNGNFLIEKQHEQQNQGTLQGMKEDQGNFMHKNQIFEPIHTGQGNNQDVVIQNRKYLNILKNINLKIRSQQITIITGDVGCGKSTLIYNILNETLAQPGQNSKVNIFGSIAYCPQKPWIMGGTVKDNIVFFNQFNEQKFRQAIYFSCLEDDIQILDKGIETQVQQKGVNLSGGQKARINLARALYSNKDIYIFDNVLSALDVHVSKFIMEKTIKGYLRGKTIVLITHSLSYLDNTDNVIIIDKGKITEETKKELQNTEENLIKKHLIQAFDEKKTQKIFLHELQNNQQQIKLNIQKQQANNQNQLINQLTLSEDQEDDQVSPEVYSKFYQMLGGRLFAISLTLMMSLWSIFSAWSNIQIQQWRSDLQNSIVYLYLYMGFAIVTALIFFIACLISMLGDLMKSRNIHEAVMKSLIYANYMQFFARVPKGRILNRLSSQLIQNDQIFTQFVWNLIILGFVILTNFLINFYVFPLIILPTAIIIIYFFMLFKQTLGFYSSVCRLEKISKSYVLNGITELISGIDVIRCFKKGQQLMDVQIRKMDASKAASLTRTSIQNWIFIKIIFLSLIICYSVFAYCIFKIQNGAKMGLFLSFIASLIEYITQFTYNFMNYKSEMVSTERLLNLTKLQPEEGYTNKTNNLNELNYFNQAIKFQHFSARYREGLPLTLKNINITIQKGRKIGIVGRTGAGKSTLFNCLLHFVEPSQGKLLINNKQVQQYNLTQLRSSVTMIEQDPTLITGTFRQNLDPTGIYTDEYIKEMLRSCNILSMIEQRGGLDSMLSNSSISVGEKQIICICRALLKNSQVVLIDEATAHIDSSNDRLIHEMISKVFKQSTVLIIAHRLSTLRDCQQILVLKEGQVLQWGSTPDLLSNPQSVFKKMWETQDISYLQ